MGPRIDTIRPHSGEPLKISRRHFVTLALGLLGLGTASAVAVNALQTQPGTNPIGEGPRPSGGLPPSRAVPVPTDVAPTAVIKPEPIAAPPTVAPSAEPTIASTQSPPELTAAPQPTAEPALPISTPVPEVLPGVPMPDKNLIESSIGAYAEVMGIEPETVQMSYKEVKDAQGNTFAIAISDDGTPILITIKNPDGTKIWTDNTIRPLFNLHGLQIGGHVDGSEEYRKPIYGETAQGNFDILFPAGAFFQSSLDKGDRSTNAFLDMARTGNSIVYIHAGFYRYDQAYLERIPAGQRRARMEERAKTLLQFVKKVDGVSQRKPTYINIFNEPFGRYITAKGQDVASWKVESLAQQTLGNNTIIDTYIMFYEEAKSQGLEIGKDVFFFFSEYGVNTNNPKKDMALRELQRAKSEIAKRLGIPVDQVKFGLALEQRYDESNPMDLPNDQRGRIRPPTEKELESTIQEFQQVADWIIFTEASDNPATAEQRQARFATLVKTAKKLGLLGVVFENPLRFHQKEPDMTSSNTDLFTPSYQKSKGYYNLARGVLNLS